MEEQQQCPGELYPTREILSDTSSLQDALGVFGCRPALGYARTTMTNAEGDRQKALAETHEGRQILERPRGRLGEGVDDKGEEDGVANSSGGSVNDDGGVVDPYVALQNGPKQSIEDVRLHVEPDENEQNPDASMGKERSLPASKNLTTKGRRCR